MFALFSSEVSAVLQVGLTMAEVQRDILSWDYHSIMQGAPGRALKGLGMMRVPVQFGSLQEYCKVFRVLLLEELKAHLLQASKQAVLMCSFGCPLPCSECSC